MVVSRNDGAAPVVQIPEFGQTLVRTRKPLSIAGIPNRVARDAVTVSAPFLRPGVDCEVAARETNPREGTMKTDRSSTGTATRSRPEPPVRENVDGIPLDAIAQRAYELYVASGSEHGRDV